MSSIRSMAGTVPSGYRHDHAPPGFALGEFLQLLAARRRLILQVAVATVLAAALTALLLPTRYSSSALVMLDQRRNTVTDLSAVLSQLPSDPAGLQNQLQILTSRQLAGAVIARLALYNDPEFNRALAPPGLGDLPDAVTALLNPGGAAASDDPQRRHDRIVDAFLKHITAEIEGISTVITVTASSRDPVKAALIANTLVDQYGKAQVATKVGATNGTTDWLTTRIHDLAQQLQVQQEAVQRYKAQHDLTDTGPGNSLVDQQLAGINAQIVQARSDLAEKQAVYDRVTALVAAGDTADVSQVVSSPLIVQLRTQQADLIRAQGQLSTTFGPLHPRMQEIEAQKRELDQKIAQEVSRIAGSISNDLMVAQAHLKSLEASLGGVQRQASGQNMARVQLQALESNAASTRGMYEAFVSRLRQAQDQDDVQAPESRVISAAPIPLHPSAPHRGLIVAGSLPLGLLLGVLAALLAEKYSAALPQELPRPMMRPMAQPPRPVPLARPAPRPRPLVLAEIPDARQMASAEYLTDVPSSRFAKAMVELVTELEADPGHGGGAVIAVTAAELGESKSAIAVSLARIAAKMGKKVVLVDCDPALSASRSLHAAVAGGLYEVLTGTAPLNQALARDARGPAWLLGMPRRPPNAATMFASLRMKQLVATLSEGADLVILDCPIVVTGPEAALIARQADATILVALRESLHAAAPANAVHILENAQAAPIAIVVAA